jgi:elongator complex protein 1
LPAHPSLVPPAQSKSQSSKIRQGSPQEEEQLAEHVLGLAPHAATCAEVGALAELLVVLGHAADAALLQQRLGSLVAAQAAAAADVLAHPPPALALSLPRDAAASLAAAAGPPAAAAAAAALAGLPGAALQQRVAAAEAAVREAHWKWDLLREEPPVPPLAANPAGTDAGAATGADT